LRKIQQASEKKTKAPAAKAAPVPIPEVTTTMCAEYISVGRGPTIEVKLSRPDYFRFKTLAETKRVSQAELMREAALFFLNRFDNEVADKEQSVYAEEMGAARTLLLQAIEKSTNRMCALMAKTAISCEATNQFLLNMENGRELMEQARQIASKRIRQRINPNEKEISELFATQTKEE
jgi:hypothetical protein